MEMCGFYDTICFLGFLILLGYIFHLGFKGLDESLNNSKSSKNSNDKINNKPLFSFYQSTKKILKPTEEDIKDFNISISNNILTINDKTYTSDDDGKTYKLVEETNNNEEK